MTPAIAAPVVIDRTKPESWPAVLTLAEVAVIYQRTPEAIRHALKPGRARVSNLPAPFQRHPARWRRADVRRHVEGAR
jgi:hypothetical protein